MIEKICHTPKINDPGWSERKWSHGLAVWHLHTSQSCFLSAAVLKVEFQVVFWLITGPVVLVFRARITQKVIQLLKQNSFRTRMQGGLACQVAMGLRSVNIRESPIRRNNALSHLPTHERLCHCSVQMGEVSRTDLQKQTMHKTHSFIRVFLCL